MPEFNTAEDFTKDTAFGDEPAHRNGEHQLRVSAVLRTYCTPLLKYDGMTAYELAGLILDAIAEPEDSVVRR